MNRCTKKQGHCTDCDPSFNCYGDDTVVCRKTMGWPPFLSPPTPHDWEEDPANDPDNGCYQNSCIVCNQPFVGNKRRAVCKLCSAPTSPIPPTFPNPSIETLLRRLLNKAHTVGQDDYRQGASDSSVQRHDEEFQAAQEEVMKAIAALKEQIVWGFYEEEIPQYTQGLKGEHELTSPITAEKVNGLVKTIIRLKTFYSRAVCPDCGNQGWYRQHDGNGTEVRQVQCQWCTERTEIQTQEKF